MTVNTREVRGIFGPAGSGKTHLAAKLYGQEPRAIVYNFMRDVQFTSKSTLVLRGNWITAERLAKFALNSDLPVRIDFQPTDVGKKERESFDEVCKQVRIIGESLMRRERPEKSALYVDETHLLTNAGWAPEEFLTLIFTGRHLQISMCYMAMSFSAVAKDITRQTSGPGGKFDLFQTYEPRDLDAIAERFAGGLEVAGFHERQSGQDIAGFVTGLRRADLKQRPVVGGQYLEIDCGTGTAKIME